METDLVTNNPKGHLTSPSGLITNEDHQIPPDQVQPLEQWLLSKESVCFSAHLSYSSQDPVYLNHSNQTDSLSANADVHSMFHNPAVDFTNTSYQKPQKNVSSKQQPFLPVDCGSSQMFAEQPRPQQGLQGMPSEHSHNLENLGLSSACSQPLIISSNVHRSGLHSADPVQFPEVNSPQHTLTKVPSNSLLTSLKTAGNSVATSNNGSSHGDESLSIKPEPEEENELRFQTIGLQDITLDDGKALKV